MLAGKKIVVLLETFGLGGAERQALHLSRHLRDHERADVKMLAFSGPGTTSALCEEYGIPWKLLPFAWSERGFELLGRLVRVALGLRREKPVLLLPYTSLPNVVSGLTWRFSGAAACIWNQRDEGRGLTTRRIHRYAVKQTPFFLANSIAGSEFLRRTYHVEEKQLRIIHNGVAPAPPLCGAGEWRLRLHVKQDSFLALMVAHLHRYKDHETLLRAWKRVQDGIPDADSAFLLLAGKDYGPLPSLTRLAAELGIAGSVRFLGQVKDITGLLQAVDLGIHSSRFEGCPNSVLECMAAGLPVVGTNIAGLREALGPVNDGYLAPPGDDEALAALILKFHRDRELRATVGKQNQLYVAKEFSLDAMCRSTVEHLTACVLR